MNITAAGRMTITCLVNVQECLFNETCKYIYIYISFVYIHNFTCVTDTSFCVTTRLKTRCVIVVAAMSLSYILQIHDPHNSFIPYKRQLSDKIRRP